MFTTYWKEIIILKLPSLVAKTGKFFVGEENKLYWIGNSLQSGHQILFSPYFFFIFAIKQGHFSIFMFYNYSSLTEKIIKKFSFKRSKLILNLSTVLYINLQYDKTTEF